MKTNSEKYHNIVNNFINNIKNFGTGKEANLIIDASQSINRYADYKPDKNKVFTEEEKNKMKKNMDIINQLL